MNESAFQKIKELLITSFADFQVYTHTECRTSEESVKVRKEVGMPDAVGAKALVCKVTFKSSIIPVSTSESSSTGSPESTLKSFFGVFVLPGSHTIDKTKLKADLPEMKEYRFATPEELLALAGVVPGCMPPFGSQIFPGISKMYVATALEDFERVAFNAAKLDTSITLPREQYMKLVTPDASFDFSTQKI